MSRLTPLYDVKLIKDKNQHFYALGDDPVWRPGVTSVLGIINKPALIPWAAKTVSSNIKESLFSEKGTILTDETINRICEEGKNIYKKKAEKAADLGTRAHKAIDDMIRGMDPQDIQDDIKPCLDAFNDWKGRQTLNFELGDTKIGSRLFGYGGSLDCLGFDGDKVILIDLKTSNGIWPEMAYQLAAYTQAFKETYGIEVSEALILRLGKDKPEFEVKRVANLKDCFDGFLAALKLYNLSKWGKFVD